MIKYGTKEKRGNFMKIGIDIDGVILDFDQKLRVKQELYDVLTLKRNSISNEKETFFQAKYNWSKKEQNDFIQKEFGKLGNIFTRV